MPGANGTNLAEGRGGDPVEVKQAKNNGTNAGWSRSRGKIAVMQMANILSQPGPGCLASSADDKVAQLLRDSGVLRAMQQDALDVNLRCVANSQGFELLHISHRHHPAVELSIYLGNLEEHCNTVRLRSKVCRLLHAASVRVSAANVFARYRRAVVRVAFVPAWD